MSNSGPRPFEIREHASVRGKRYFTVTGGGRLILQTFDRRQLQFYREANKAALDGALAAQGKPNGG